MFGISFTELMLAALVGILALGPKEVIKGYKMIKECKDSITNSFKDVREELRGYTESSKKEISDYIVDQEGNLQQTYNLEELKPYIKKDNDQ